MIGDLQVSMDSFLDNICSLFSPQINYREWMNLESQDAKAKFIDSIINKGKHP